MRLFITQCGRSVTAGLLLSLIVATSALGASLRWQVVSSGAVEASGSLYAMQATIGQCAVGASTSENYGIGSGVWSQPPGGEPGCCQLRADVNHDGVGPDIADLVYLVNYMFKSGPPPPCEDPAGSGYFAEADINGDATGPDIADLVYLVNYMFKQGPDPVPCGAGGVLAVAATGGSCGLTARDLGDGHHELVVEADFPSPTAGLEQSYHYDAEFLTIDSVTMAPEHSEIEVLYSAENGRLTMGVIDLEGVGRLPAGRSKIASIWVSQSGQEELERLFRHEGSLAADEQARTVAVEYREAAQEQPLPRSFALHQNYPNPFNPSTAIKFCLPKAAHTTLTIYNVMGQRVATLVDQTLPAGEHAVTWNSDGNGRTASGVYFYKLETDGFSATKKMLLLK